MIKKKLLEAIENATSIKYSGNIPVLQSDQNRAAEATYAITKETAKGFAEWITEVAYDSMSLKGRQRGLDRGEWLYIDDGEQCVKTTEQLFTIYEESLKQ